MPATPTKSSPKRDPDSTAEERISTALAKPPLASKAFLLCVGLWISVEVIVRVFFTSSMSGRFDYGYHPTSGFIESQDGTLTLERSGGRRFLPQQYPQHPPSEMTRIMVVGDSVPRGSSLDSSYARQLAARLSARGVTSEGWNLAVPGYGVRRVQLVLKQALHYHPSLVILHVNNSNEFEDEREYRRSQEFRSWHPKNWLMKSLALRRLYEAKTEKISWELLPEAVRSRQGVNDADAEIAASMSPKKLQEWDERVQRETAASVALCQSAGVPILLITQARRERGTDGRATLEDHGLDAMVRPLTNSRVAHLSMREVFRDADLASTFADSAHVRPPGHGILAAAIEARIREAGWIREKR